MDSMEVPGELHIVKKAPPGLTAPLEIAIIQIKGTPRKAAGPSNSINWTDKRPPRNRHLPEWRFLLFTIIVTVNRPICNVIRIRPHLLSEDVASRLSAAQHSRSSWRSGNILSFGILFVKCCPRLGFLWIVLPPPAHTTPILGGAHGNFIGQLHGKRPAL